MTDEFILEVQHDGRPQKFPAQLQLQGYTHKFKVFIHGLEVFFEPDEEGSYRAVKMAGQDDKQLEKMDRGLLQAIQEKIKVILS